MTEKNVDNISKKTEQPKSGPFLAKVVNHLDPAYMGTLEVEILRTVGNDEKSDGQLHQVRMMSPFWGQTSVDHDADRDASVHRAGDGIRHEFRSQHFRHGRECLSSHLGWRLCAIGLRRVLASRYQSRGAAVDFLRHPCLASGGMAWP